MNGLKNLKQTEEQIAEVDTELERVAIVEKFLLSNLVHTHSDPLIKSAIQRIKTSNGVLKIHELADSLNISLDPFEKRFRSMVGASPKQFSKIIKLKSLISSYNPAQSLTELAQIIENIFLTKSIA